MLCAVLSMLQYSECLGATLAGDMGKELVSTADSEARHQRKLGTWSSISSSSSISLLSTAFCALFALLESLVRRQFTAGRRAVSRLKRLKSR